MSHRPVMLMTEEPATITAVTSALSSNGQLFPENVCRDVHGLSARLIETSASAALIDIDFHPARVLASLDPMVRRFPDTRFIVVASAMDPRLMLEAMQAGARHFMLKQELSATLRDVIRRLCYGGTSASGQVVNVFSASGGCGATMVAVNLAWELQAIGAGADKPGLLVDLDYAYGAVGAYLGVEGAYGVLDLQERNGAIDPELIKTTSVPYHDRLRILVSASPARLCTGGSYPRLSETIAGCALMSPLVVVDAPRLPLSIAAELARISSINLIVMQLNVKDVRNARNFLASMRSAGVAPDNFTLLINRYRRRSALIELEEAKRALEGARIECLSNDFPSVNESINLGRPLEQVAPRSTIRKEIQALARTLTVQGRMSGATA